MMRILLIALLVAATGFLSHENYQLDKAGEIKSIYLQCGLSKDLSFNVFRIAMAGMQKLNGIKNKRILTIVDYSKPSSQARFYVIDLVSKRILYITLVAHGKNSGDFYAKTFSNVLESKESCLGFFLTAETYNGEHGYSLSLDGLEPGINDNARIRSIVIHGADYVSSDFVEKYGRLGRSWGCPALPASVSKEIIDRISKGSCLFIYGNDPEYLKTSKILNGIIFDVD
jgi:hypothetical protein